MAGNPTTAAVGRTTQSMPNRRRQQTLEHIYNYAARQAENSALDGMTMKDFAEGVGVTVNTVKRQGFQYVTDVADALLNHLDVLNRTLSPTALAHLRKAARQSAAQAKRERVHESHDKITDYRDRVRSGVEHTPKVIAVFQSLHNELTGTHPEEGTLLAEVSNFLAELHLRTDTELSDEDALEAALEWAQRGIQYLDSDGRTRNFALGTRLTRHGSSAARSLITQVNRRLPDSPTDEDRKDARLAAGPYLSNLISLLAREQQYHNRLNHPVRAADAEFHRDRAEALLVSGTKGERGEIDAALKMARFLDKASAGPLPEDILTTFLTRLCATQVAYQDTITAAEHRELNDIRPRLINAIDEKSTAMKRAMKALFTLADIDLGTQDPNTELPSVHLTDLMLVSTCGVVGRLLLAEHLQRAADSAETDKPLYDPSEILTIGKVDFQAAAKHWYEAAPRDMNVTGVAAKLSDRARQTLAANPTITAAGDTRPWAILDENSDGLNTLLLKQLSVGAVTGTPPTKNQAETLLDELEPLLMVLRSISRGATDPVFK